jgi:hypothetical protein
MDGKKPGYYCAFLEDKQRREWKTKPNTAARSLRERLKSGMSFTNLYVLDGAMV